jgi:signal transduction histidine kinase
LRGIVQDIMLPGIDGHFTYMVAGPVSHIENRVGVFTKTIALALALLGAGLMGAVLFQVHFGLRPLRTLQLALGRMRKGLSTRLPETFPEEVQPLVSELNAVLDHNAALVERARIQASNLTHALKNPLTVIQNEAIDVPGEQGHILRDQAHRMKEAINRFRSQAHTAATAQVLGARSSVNDVVEDLCFSMDLLHKDRHLTIRRSGLDSLYFRGDAQDLEEILGNLIDNACKWARQEVAIVGESLAGWLRITVEEDGPGIPEDQLAHALERGRRLDESVTGSGLGFDIVLDITEVYRGSLSLEKSALGGLKAVLELPAAS